MNATQSAVANLGPLDIADACATAWLIMRSSLWVGGHVGAQIVPWFATRKQQDPFQLDQDEFLRHSRGLVLENVLGLDIRFRLPVLTRFNGLFLDRAAEPNRHRGFIWISQAWGCIRPFSARFRA
jgi:hypothetical protein